VISGKKTINREMDGLQDFLSTFWDILGSLVRLGANILTQQKPLELLEKIPLVGQNGTTKPTLW